MHGETNDKNLRTSTSQTDWFSIQIKRNKIESINTYAISFLKYGVNVITYPLEELKSLDKNTRYLRTRYLILHLKMDIDRLYLPIKRVGKGLIRYEQSIRAKESKYHTMACIPRHISTIIESRVGLVYDGK